jgi:hypothetical protein
MSSFFGFFLNGAHLWYGHPVFLLLQSLESYWTYNTVSMEQTGQDVLQALRVVITEQRTLCFLFSRIFRENFY